MNFEAAFLNEVEILKSWKTKMDQGFGDLGSQEIKEGLKIYACPIRVRYAYIAKISASSK